MIETPFLDFMWKSIFAATISSTAIISLIFILHALIRKYITNEQSKWFFNFHSGLLITAVTLGSVALLRIDPELTSACFSQFAKKTDSYNITRLLSGLYLSVILISFLYDVFKCLITFKKMKSLVEVKNGTAFEIFNELKKNLNIKSADSLFVSNSAQSPFVWGLFKYKLVVTKSILETDDKQKVKTILSHELMHIKGNDSLWILLSYLCRKILFFNPLIYLFFSKHRMATEMAADELAIQKCGVTPNTLLSSIIEIAEQCTKKQNTLLQSNASQGFHEIKERIQAVTNLQSKKLNWVFPTFSALSLLSSIFIVVAQARASVGTPNIIGRNEIMCSQIKHEKIIEIWLRIEPSPNKCEMN